MDISELSGRQKAAILMVALGAEASAKIVKDFDPEFLEELTFEIASLGSVPPELKQQVLEEHKLTMQANDYISFGGVDYARETLSKAVGEDRAEEILAQVEKSIAETPFSSIKKADPAQILNVLQNEQPQVIAVVLTHLSHAVAAVVLQALPGELQVDVTLRMSQMEPIPSIFMKRLEEALEQKLASAIESGADKTDGVKNVVELLNRVDWETGKDILSKLSEQDPELANEVRGLMLTFDDIVMVTDTGIQRLLKETDNKDLSLALKAANEDVRNKMFSNMSNRAAEMIEEDMEYMGPVRMRDAEAAQRRIVEIIRLLEETGEIEFLGRGDENQLVI